MKQLLIIAVFLGSALMGSSQKIIKQKTETKVDGSVITKKTKVEYENTGGNVILPTSSTSHKAYRAHTSNRVHRMHRIHRIHRFSRPFHRSSLHRTRHHILIHKHHLHQDHKYKMVRKHGKTKVKTKV